MIESLKKIKNPSRQSENWVQHLYFTRQSNYNYERLNKINDLNNKLVYNYVINTLNELDQISSSIDSKVLYYVEETLKYCDVAKTGSSKKRKEWELKGFNLYVHNIGSAQIYVDENSNYNEIVRVLIKTHGLIGQYLRGEVPLTNNMELTYLIKNDLIDKNTLREVLIILNKCILSAVSKNLYDKLKDDIQNIIEIIVNDQYSKIDNSIYNKMSRLNPNKTEEELGVLNDLLKNNEISSRIRYLFDVCEFWYYEASLNDFSILEQIKLLLIIYNLKKDNISHINFQKIMEIIYIDYKDKKECNIYTKRIIETYLNEVSIPDILNNNIKPNPHISIELICNNETSLVNFKFSIQAKKLIEFCEVAYNSNSLYQKAVFILYDLFGFRRDQYDRFYNEIDYLNTMNSSLQYKSKILDYIVGENVLDVGPGGGALMDLMLDKNPNLNVYGIDIAQNVIDSLNKKKKKENRSWNVIQGDALNLDKFFKVGSIDTIIYSSIIHELYSYIEYNGKKFNHETIAKTLTSAYSILPKGGRIIIRDGIMTEPTNQYRIISFRNESDIEILKRYSNDFKGRNIKYELLNNNTVKMLVNDAMEFLYTYTWGEDSYALEVKEQFGYFTPSDYQKFINDNLDNCKILMCKPFLQEGYEENLLNKITIYDDNYNQVKLPNSTCIIVIEKK